MVVAIDEWLLIAIVGVGGLMFVFGIALFFILRSNAPDAFVHWKANRTGKNVCRVVFRGKTVKDFIAEEEKAEKDVGTNYWTVPGLGIKFKPDSDDVYFIEGSIPCVTYFEKLPKSIKMQEVIALSQLKDYLKKIGLPIDGMEKQLLYILQEIQKKPEDRAIKNAKIDSTETKQYLHKYLSAIKERTGELNKLKLESGVFTYQTAMRAMDDTIAYTSANIAHTKEVIRAAILRSEDNKRKDWITYAVVGFILCIGAATIIVVAGK